MKKAPSTILATAGITVGMLGIGLPASASTASHAALAARRLPVPAPTLPVTWPTKTWPTKPVPNPTKPVSTPTKPVTTPTTPITLPTKPTWPTKPTEKPTGQPTGKPTGKPTKPKGYHPGKPGKGHPAPKPKEVCHRVYTKAPHLTAQEQKKHPSWQQPKEGYVIKCTTVKPVVKKPVHHGPPPHHKAPAKKHPWWHFW